MTTGQKAAAVGLVVGIAVLGAGVGIWRLLQPKPKPLAGGSIELHLDSVDEQFLNQIQPVPSPNAADPPYAGSADPAYGGSGLEQSPQYDLETWKTILKDDLQ